MTEETSRAGDKATISGWRIKLAYALFITSLVGMPIALPLVAFLGFSATFIATFTAVGSVAAELMLVAGAAVAGKQGFAQIKATVFGFLKQYGPPAKVGKGRYRIGLIMFIIPFVYGFAVPYLQEYLPQYVTVLSEHSLAFAVGGDALLVGSLIVLGGDFWEKLRSLFIHRAYAVIPERPAKQATAN